MPTLHKRARPYGYDETDYYIINKMHNKTSKQFTTYQVSDAGEQRLRRAGVCYDEADISKTLWQTLRNFKEVYTKQTATELLTAAKEGNTNKVINLINTKISAVNVKDKDGRTALSWAAERGHIAIVQFLISQGADKKIEDVCGFNARWWADFNCQIAIARLL